MEVSHCDFLPRARETIRQYIQKAYSHIFSLKHQYCNVLIKFIPPFMEVFYGVSVNKMWQGCLWKCNKAGFSREKGVARMDGCGYLRLHHQCCCWTNLTSLAKSKRQQQHLAAVIIPKNWSDRSVVLIFPLIKKDFAKAIWGWHCKRNFTFALRFSYQTVHIAFASMEEFTLGNNCEICGTLSLALDGMTRQKSFFCQFGQSDECVSQFF